MNNCRNRPFAVAIAVACTLAMGIDSRAGDPGELFPNLAPYDETVSSPISKPEVRKAAPTTLAPTPVPSPTPDTPGVDPLPPGPDISKPPVKKKPVRVTGTQPATQSMFPPSPPPPPLVEYRPYVDLIMRPIVSPEDYSAFEQGYAGPITKALAGTPEQRKKTAELLESSAQSVTSPELKRYVLLHAFGLFVRAGLPSSERELKAQVLLPLLTDRTLPVMQARADALNDLYLTFSANPNNAFLDLYVDAHAMLTKYRVQAGFPNEAQDSLKKMREAASRYLNKPQVRTDEINEAAAWADRARAAAKLAPGYQAALKANPDDPAANTMMATLHLSLYGNLEYALPFAARSDRKEFRQLSAVLQENPPEGLSKEPAKHAEQVLAIGAALVDVAKATSPAQLFDRYSIACFAGDHVSQVVDDGVMPAAKMLEAKTLLANAKEIVEKTHLKRGEDLPVWLGGTGSSNGPGVPAVAKHTLGSVGDFLKGLPKELLPADAGWTQAQINQINDWMSKNHRGQLFDARVFVERVDPPVEGMDAKTYVPVMFQFQNAQLKDQLWVRTFVEVRMSPAMAARAKDLAYEQVVQVKGTIESARLSQFSSFPGEPRTVMIHVIVLNQE